MYRTKEDFKNKNGVSLKVMRGDTTDCHLFFRKNSMDLIIGDLPYGVQHKGKSGGENVRNLEAMLEKSFKSWHQVLKKGGAIGLSWNTYTNKRQDLAALLVKNGLTVVDSEVYLGFQHRVSQAINRDIIVALK